MGACSFRGCCPGEELIRGDSVCGADFGEVEGSGGEGSGFVEDDGSGAGEGFEVVAAFDEDTVSGCSADAAVEAEGDGDDEGTGAGDDEEDEGTAYPVGEGFTEEKRREDCEGCGDEDDGRGVVPGEGGDEVLGFCFFGCGVFDEVEDFCDG